MVKRYLSAVLLTSIIIGSSINVDAATSKSGTKVSGEEVLTFVEENIPTEEEMLEEEKEAEVAVVIQTRAIASQPRHGFTAVNYGAVLSTNGKEEGPLPRLTHKKNPKRNSWKYISEVSTHLFMPEFTNRDENYGIYQKKSGKDAFKEETVYYAAIGAEGKKQLTSINVAGLKDKANAQYINPESNFYAYDIKDPEKDEVIGKMFIEVKKASAKPEKERLR